MKRMHALLLAVLTGLSPSSFAADGLVSVRSPYPVGQTLDRLESAAKQRGLKVFVRIDHAAGASSVGKSLRPTELLVFGNPQGGTPLMQCAQSAGIDLPLKALAWQDEQGQVWLAYNDPAYVARRHEIAGCPAVAPIAGVLSGLVAETVAR